MPQIVCPLVLILLKFDYKETVLTDALPFHQNTFAISFVITCSLVGASVAGVVDDVVVVVVVVAAAVFVLLSSLLLLRLLLR